MRLLVGALMTVAAAAAGGQAHAARPIQFAAQVPTSGVLVLPLASVTDLDVRAASLDTATRTAVARALAAARFDYKANATLSLRGLGSYDRILIVGTGSAPLTAATLQGIAGIAGRETRKDLGPVTLVATGLAPGVADGASQLAVGAGLGGYSFDLYKTSGEKTAGSDAPLTIVTASPDQARAAYDRDGRALAEAVAFARDLTTEPANVIYPESFVERTREAFKGVANVRIEAIDVPQMEKLGMGVIAAVGKGSVRPPRMLVIEYSGGGDRAPVVLAGKGITFDSGGISLKPGEGMWQMKDDMAGAAAVTAAVLSLAKSRAPVNAVAIAALAENMPGGSATRPGDVVRAFNGKTIEVINTDAEGRLVLADAVAYGDKRFKPAAIVDVATLTGAVGRALGKDYAGLFSRHDSLADQLTAAGRATGEQLWRLPLTETYAEDMKSDIADIKNSVEGGNPGAGFGAHFIGFFVEPTTPWAHLDIANMAWSSKDAPTTPKGATAFSVRLLDRFVRDFQPVPAGTAPVAASR